MTMEPIEHSEKGLGAIEAVESVGISIRCVDGVWLASDASAAQGVLDSYEVADAIVYRQHQVALHAKRLRNVVISHLSPGEMASWPIKVSEARAFAASGNPEDAPMLAAEASARQVTMPELVAKVDSNAANFAMLEAVIAGVDGYHRDRLAECATFEEVSQYDIAADWPEV